MHACGRTYFATSEPSHIMAFFGSFDKGLRGQCTCTTLSVMHQTRQEEVSCVTAAGNNNLYGTVPSSWSRMAQLQDLQLDDNCRVCGTLPTFPMQVCALASHAHILAYIVVCICAIPVKLLFGTCSCKCHKYAVSSSSGAQSKG